MEEHETRRKIIREWMKLPKDKRRTEEQVVAFAKGAVQQNEFQRSRRDSYQKVIGWLLPRNLLLKFRRDVRETVRGNPSRMIGNPPSKAPDLGARSDQGASSAPP